MKRVVNNIHRSILELESKSLYIISKKGLGVITKVKKGERGIPIKFTLNLLETDSEIKPPLKLSL